MYQFHYDHWDSERFPGYVFSMRCLYHASSTFLKLQSNDLEKDCRTLNELFGYTEYYLAGLLKNRFIGKSNFSYVLDQLKNIKLIKLLDESLRNTVNGLTYEGVLSINPKPVSFTGLDEKESLQLSIFHELGHVITEGYKDDLELLQEYVYEEDDLIRELDDNPYDAFCMGFELLDEVCVENAAEVILFDREGRKRPKTVLLKSNVLNSTFSSNFVEYREFQELAYQFLCCLDFIPKGLDMNDALNRFSKEMFSSDFVDTIGFEFFKSPEKTKDLIMMLICMGKIKDAKYSSFEGKNKNLDVSKYFEIFHSIASKYLDERKEIQKIQS